MNKTNEIFFLFLINNLLPFSQITQEERKGAEVDYRKYYGQAWKDAGGHQDPVQNKPSADFVKEHPRYQELIESKKG